MTEVMVAAATTIGVLHPRGGVGRSTTVYILGAELALRGHRVALFDRDQGQHLSPVLLTTDTAPTVLSARHWCYAGSSTDVEKR